jgi:two-component system nitrate/nitrite response regulator NarL
MANRLRRWELRAANVHCAGMKILIIDDHPLVRDAMAALLAQLDVQVQVLHAPDGESGLCMVREQANFDVVLVDLQMAGLGGPQTVEALVAGHPALPVIVISASEDPADVRRALAAGARGYCPKSLAGSTIVAAVRLVLAGEIYLPPLMLRADTSEAMARPGQELTARQRDVLRMVGEGRSNKDIARLLGLSEKTVKGHVTGIFRQLGAVNRMQAVSAARSLGWIG